MKIKLTAFGIAKDILSQRQMEFEFSGQSISALKRALVEKYPEFSKLKKLSFAVEEAYQTDDFQLSEQIEVVIIPPVSGG